ncbi:MAG: hypothetical protein LR015_01945 [Verrucomicrobia bacterium]|nr:hypothetical protein [Verrucomicrobiota bacterium]
MESEIVRIPASQATFVTAGLTWQQYAEQGRMVVGFVPNPNFQISRGWLEFDFSALPSDAVVEAAVLGLARQGDGPVNPLEVLVSDQGQKAQIGTRITWERIGNGGDTSGPVVAILSPGVAGGMREITALNTLPELKSAIERALQRQPRKMYLLLHSPAAEAQSARGHYWRLATTDDLRPVLMLQYASAELTKQ